MAIGNVDRADNAARAQAAQADRARAEADSRRADEENQTAAQDRRDASQSQGVNITA